MKFNRSILSIVAVLLISLLSGCGFHLKGQYYLPKDLQTLHLSSSDKFNPLAKQVKIRLIQNQVNVIEQREENVSELRIFSETFQRRSLSLFPNGQVAEYELIYQVTFEVRKPNEEAQTFNIELQREFQDDPNNALAKQKERELILKELRVIASDRILNQLNTVQ